MEKDFEEFWKQYPKRLGPQNKPGARASFEKKVKQGVDPQKIIAAAKVYAIKRDWVQGMSFYQRQYADRAIPMAQTWLNQNRFNDPDYQPAESASTISAERAAELEARYQERRKREGWL